MSPALKPPALAPLNHYDVFGDGCIAIVTQDSHPTWTEVADAKISMGMKLVLFHLRDDWYSCIADHGGILDYALSIQLMPNLERIPMKMEGLAGRLMVDDVIIYYKGIDLTALSALRLLFK